MLLRALFRALRVELLHFTLIGKVKEPSLAAVALERLATRRELFGDNLGGKQLLEITNASFVELASLVRAAREALRDHGVPAYALTLLRNPVDYAVSVFNSCCGCTREQCRGDEHSATLRAFVRWITPNLQCTSLYHVWSCAPSASVGDCGTVFDRLREVMDHIGDAARLEDTLKTLVRFVVARKKGFAPSGGAGAPPPPPADLLPPREDLVEDRAKVHWLRQTDLAYEHLDALATSQAGDWDVYHRQAFEDLCLVKGTFVRGNRSQPYHLGSKQQAGAKAMCEDDTARAWVDWNWHPDDPACVVARSDIDVCAALRNRSVLFVGDSTSFQQWESLSFRAGFQGQTGMQQREARPKPAIVCGGARVAYIRNDLLTEMEGSADLRGCDFCWPFKYQLQNYDVLVFNRGIHVVDTLRLVDQTREFAKYILESKRAKGRQLLFWRTTVPGHADCGEHPSDVNPKVYTPRPHHRYKWDVVQGQNVHVALESFGPHLFHYIDAYYISNRRRDRHVSKSDCLHYCLPGPPDDWNDHLLTTLAELNGIRY
ncbi:hypothetical protein CTAYLR_007695 [Chrysophaeum taylorii]|uniref:Trichome birefringence-like C-terminal domain-containing protein n=1 Tax=Chrysophaeum taylorii TaxID=2483200 RepID=A0AAD7U683_9STRA|nr:hypothetical protein CTAYLR_007695 [Chrysophaeum taylorii]